MLETEPKLIETYLRGGQARLVYRHILQHGEPSVVLAEASECAGAQGQFWAMRELMYQRQNELYGARTYASIAPLVEELGLDTPRFEQCLEQNEFEAQVAADYAAAQREGVNTRPVIDINGTRIVGAQPLTVYQQALAAQP